MLAMHPCLGLAGAETKLVEPSRKAATGFSRRKCSPGPHLSCRPWDLFLCRLLPILGLIGILASLHYFPLHNRFHPIEGSQFDPSE